MKLLEQQSFKTVSPDMPVYMRLDGRSFSRFTKGLRRPYDETLSNIMIEVTRELVKEFKPDLGYTQSDEISLGWRARPEQVEFPLFGGKTSKLLSVVASKASSKFVSMCYDHGGDLRYRAREMLPCFDARICQPMAVDGLIDMFEWRAQDCRRNAVTMVAQSLYTHKRLQGVSTNEMKLMIAEAGVDYSAYPEFFRRGSYLRRENFEVAVNPDIPAQYQPESGTVIRSRVVVVDDHSQRYETFN